MEPTAPMMLAALVSAALMLWLSVRVLHRAGLSGWWCLTALVPVVNMVMIWVFAFARWPALEARSGDAGFDDGTAE